MFMGHYAAAFAGKAVEPRAPMWAYLASAEMLDIAWSGAIMSGVERVGFDRSLPGAPLILEYMPWTHSLPAAVAWAAAIWWVGHRLLGLPRPAAMMLAMAVFSHWPLDLLVHRPDLALWFGGPKVGLALRNQPVVEEIIEIGVLGLAASAWLGTRGRQGLPLWPGLSLLLLLILLQLVSVLMPAMPDVTQFGVIGLTIYLGVAGMGLWIDRYDHARRPIAADPEK